MAKRNQNNTVPSVTEAKEQAKLLNAAVTADESKGKADTGIIASVTNAVSELIGSGKEPAKEVGSDTVSEFQGSTKPMAEQAQIAKVNINSATADEIAKAVPGIGETMAAKVVEYRNANKSGFRSIQDLLNVEGISEERLAAFESHVIFTDAESDSRPSDVKADEQARIDAARLSAAKKSEADNKALLNSRGNINYHPNAKNPEEFKKEASAVYSRLSSHVIEGETSLLADLSMTAADMVYLATQGTKDEKLPVKFDLGKDANALLRDIQAELRRSLEPDADDRAKDLNNASIDKESVHLSIVDTSTAKQYMPDAAKSAMLLLYGVVEYGWYDRNVQAPNWKTEVIPFENLPEGERGDRYLKCLACKYKVIKPFHTTVIRDSRSGKITKQDTAPNASDDLIYMSRDKISLLFGWLMDKSKYSTDDQGWLVPKKDTRAAQQTTGQSDTSNNANANNGNGANASAPSGDTAVSLIKSEVNAVGKILMDAKERRPSHEYDVLMNSLGVHLARRDVKTDLYKYLGANQQALKLMAYAYLRLMEGLENYFSHKDGKVYFYDGKNHVEVPKLKEGEYSKDFFGLVSAEASKPSEPAKSEEKAKDTAKTVKAA